MNKISRRGFLKTAGLLAAASTVPQWLMASAPEKRSNEAARTSRINDEYDVIVVGGGPAGCAAATAATRDGARTLLVEATGALGGLGTSGMVPAWCPFSDGEKVIYGGLAWKIFSEAKKGVPFEPADKVDWVAINPEYLMSVYDRMVTGAGVEILFFSRVAGIEKTAEDRIDALQVANKDGLTTYKAKVYVDASGDGDVAAWAGADYFKGDSEGNLQKSTLCFSVANVNMEAYLNGPELHSGHNTNSPSVQAQASGLFPLLDTHCCHNLIGPGVVGFNANHIAIADTTDPVQLSEAMIKGREIAAEHLEMLKKYRPDAFSDAFIVKTAIIPGVRDSRRIIGDYVFTADDWYARRRFDDEIGRNCYFIDIHKAGHEDIHYGPGESHGIPYRCLTPAKLKNVITAGRCISTDEESYGSLRVMPNCLVTGEAAGVASALALRSDDKNFHNVDVDELRNHLRNYGAYFL